MSDDKKKKAQKAAVSANVLESLKDIGASTGKTLKEEALKQTPAAFVDQIFGARPRKKYSGEITAGESVEMNEVFNGKHEEKQVLQKQLHFERRIHAEEKEWIDKRTNELKIQLKRVMDEVVVLSESTQDLGEETQIAAMQAPVEPGVYHVVFFEKLLEFLKSFRKKIDEAKVWMHATNKRASKKNKWGANYKKSGAKYLLSGEHYLTRSAG